MQEAVAGFERTNRDPSELLRKLETILQGNRPGYELPKSSLFELKEGWGEFVFKYLDFKAIRVANKFSLCPLEHFSCVTLIGKTRCMLS